MENSELDKIGDELAEQVKELLISKTQGIEAQGIESPRDYVLDRLIWLLEDMT